MNIMCSDFKEHPKGSLLGFFTLKLEDITFLNCSLFEKDDKRWFNFAQVPRRKDNTIVYAPIVEISQDLKKQIHPHLLQLDTSSKKA